MIPVPVSRVLAGLKPTKGMNALQREVQVQVAKMLAALPPDATITEIELENTFESAAMEVGMKFVTAKLHSEGKIPNLASNEPAYLNFHGPWSVHSQWRDPATGEMYETYEEGDHSKPPSH